MFRDFAAWLQATSTSVTIQTVEWIIPLLQSIHIVTIGIVFVSIAMVAWRTLGWARVDEPLDAVVRRFSPWLWSGLVVMAVTGVILVIGEPIRQFTSLSFWLKMGLLAAGIASAAAFRRSLSAATNSAEGAVRVSSTRTKSVAVVTVLLWVSIIFLGRAIAYDVEVWGSWSLVSGN